MFCSQESHISWQSLVELKFIIIIVVITLPTHQVSWANLCLELDEHQQAQLKEKNANFNVRYCESAAIHLLMLVTYRGSRCWAG